MNTDHNVVEEAETHFLSGNFQKSLLLCNQLLSIATNTSGEHDNEGDSSNSNLVSSLSLSLDPIHKQRRVCLYIPLANPGSDLSNAHANNNKQTGFPLIDRAASVALQSWYEIARGIDQEPKKSAAQGRNHLLPFLNVYTTDSSANSTSVPNPETTRRMPLELAVVFIRFLRTGACGHRREALHLSGEILFRISGRSLLDAASRYGVEELFGFLLVEILPFCESQSLVANLLRCLFQQGQVWKSSTKAFVITEQPNSDTVFTILSFLNSMLPKPYRISLPNGDCIVKCRRSLWELLKPSELHRSQLPDSKQDYLLEDEVARGDVEGSNKDPVKRSPVGPPWGESGGVDDALLKVSHMLKLLIRKCNHHRAGLAFLLAMVLFAWRKRTQVLCMSVAALNLFLGPFGEGIDALVRGRPPSLAMEREI